MCGFGSQSSAILAIRVHVEASFGLRRRSVRRHRSTTWARKAAATIAEMALMAGADSVAVVPVPSESPPKWDLADVPPEGARGRQS